MQIESRHDANFIIINGTEVIVMAATYATDEDKVGIMTNQGFQLPFVH